MTWSDWLAQITVADIWQQALLMFLGLSAGLSVASGVFTVFTAVGLVPRFAQHTKSDDRIVTYENAIIFGCFLGNLFSLFSGLLPGLRLHVAGMGLLRLRSVLAFCLLAIVGIFTGIYVGTLAVSIAEMLDAIPIMTHRINVKRGVSFVIAGLAVCKLLGSLFYYINGVYGW